MSFDNLYLVVPVWVSEISCLKLFSAEFGTTASDGGSKTSESTSGDAPAADTGSKYKELVVTLENGVQTIRMNRPTKYNAITWEVQQLC